MDSHFCLQLNKTTRFVYICFVFFSYYYYLLPLFATPWPTLSQNFELFKSVTHTSFPCAGSKPAGNPERAIPSGGMCPSCPLGQPTRALFILPMGTASDMINQNYVFGRLNFAILNSCREVASIILCNFCLKSYSR